MQWHRSGHAQPPTRDRTYPILHGELPDATKLKILYSYIEVKHLLAALERNVECLRQRPVSSGQRNMARKPPTSRVMPTEKDVPTNTMVWARSIQRIARSHW